MLYKNNHTIPFEAVKEVTERTFMASDSNYSAILNKFSVNFRKEENFLFVGNIAWVQGWVLDISVIKYEVAPLLESILPLLLAEEIPFKLVRNSDIAGSVLGGELGYVQLGKVMSLYPANTEKAKKLAFQLIKLTAAFKGTDIITDYKLGGRVYTRYGAGNPIVRLNNGVCENYIYDSTGNLIKEPMCIPFKMPKNVEWPFTDIAPLNNSKKTIILKDIYKPWRLLKEDARGSVTKALWLEKIYKIKWCVIKEGKQNMIFDEWGRSMHDHLLWQYELQSNLHSYLPLAKPYDFFRENDDSYFVMQYIPGMPLDTIVVNIFHGRPWSKLSVDSRLTLLNYAEQILNIIEKMHAKGYIHRDIAPNNFLVDRNEQLHLIDLELCYSQILNKPFPPFRLGTFGFMSPEQEVTALPTPEQDIYSIGAIFTVLLTGLMPLGFARKDCDRLVNQIRFFIKDPIFSDTIGHCFSNDPESRPSITILKEGLLKFRELQLLIPSDSSDTLVTTFNKYLLEKVINIGISGLANPAFITREHLWVSRTEEAKDLSYYQSVSVSVYKGFYQGLSGILYVLSKAIEGGYTISNCMRSYEASLKDIRRDIIAETSYTPAGLYHGTAGMALSLVEGIKAGLINIDLSVENDIKHCLKNENVEGSDIESGYAGKGLALLGILSVIKDSELESMLHNMVRELLLRQQNDGSWLSKRDNKNRTVKATGYSNGVAGIICFLLSYFRQYQNSMAKTAAIRGLQWLMQNSKKRNGKFFWTISDKVKHEDPGMQQGLPGITLCFIKAYEILGDFFYRNLAENLIRQVPENYIKRDLTLSSGLVGIGELHLEAAKVFGSEEHTHRANWIAQVLLNYFVQAEDGSYNWSTQGIPLPLPGLMLGNCGVIHFLMRLHQPTQFSHPLLIV